MCKLGVCCACFSLIVKESKLINQVIINQPLIISQSTSHKNFLLCRPRYLTPFCRRNICSEPALRPSWSSNSKTWSAYYILLQTYLIFSYLFYVLLPLGYTRLELNCWFNSWFDFELPVQLLVGLNFAFNVGWASNFWLLFWLHFWTFGSACNWTCG